MVSALTAQIVSYPASIASVPFGEHGHGLVPEVFDDGAAAADHHGPRDVVDLGEQPEHLFVTDAQRPREEVHQIGEQDGRRDRPVGAWTAPDQRLPDLHRREPEFADGTGPLGPGLSDQPRQACRGAVARGGWRGLGQEPPGGPGGLDGTIAGIGPRQELRCAARRRDVRAGAVLGGHRWI